MNNGFQFKTIAIGFREPNARWKGRLHGIEPLIQRCRLNHNRIWFWFWFWW